MADVVITSSQNATDLLLDDGYSREKVITLPDSVDTSIFTPRASFDPASQLALRRSLGIPDGRLVVVYLGLLAQYQGTDQLLDAAKRLVTQGLPVHFLIMGFPGEDAYKARAAEMGLADHCTFTGAIPYEDAPRYLSLGDVAVSPKISETEGNGKLLNYMASGLPTVAYNTPVAREILGDVGVYARTGDVDDLAQALASLLQDGKLRSTRSDELRSRAEESFSWTATGRKLLGIYQSLTATKRVQPAG